MFTAVVVTAAITAVVAFPAGILLAKTVISDTERIKVHFTQEMEEVKAFVEQENAKIREEVKSAIERAAKKL